MKRLLPFMVLVTLLFAAPAFAQVKSNLIFFTEEGERFTVILNGLRQNETPETNVKVMDLPAPSYKLKVIFEDASLGSFDKNLMFNQGTETTYVIRKNNKNEYVIRYMNEIPMEQALPVSSGQQVVVYNTQPAPVQTVTQTTVVESYENNTTEGVSMDINVNDQYGGVNFNMSINAADVPATSQSTTTTTSYTTTTYNQPPTSATYVLPGYTGPVGCDYPMHPADFASVKQSIASKSFDDTRLTIAQQVISSNCLLSSQVKEIMLLFTFEDTRLDLAKFAYGFTHDIGNFYKLNDAFTFESSIEELNQYIENHRH